MNGALGDIRERNPANWIEPLTVDLCARRAGVESNHWTQPHIHEVRGPQDGICHAAGLDLLLDMSFRAAEWNVVGENIANGHVNETLHVAGSCCLDEIQLPKLVDGFQ